MIQQSGIHCISDHNIRRNYFFLRFPCPMFSFSRLSCSNPLQIIRRFVHRHILNICMESDRSSGSITLRTSPYILMRIYIQLHPSSTEWAVYYESLSAFSAFGIRNINFYQRFNINHVFSFLIAVGREQEKRGISPAHS